MYLAVSRLPPIDEPPMRGAFTAFIAALSFLSLPRVLAQGVDIRGTVSDSVTGERLPYVTVTLEGTNRGAATNADGFYMITSVPFGRVEITAHALGYEKKSRRFLVQALAQVNVNFKLTPQPIQESEVVSEGVRKPEIAEIYSSVHVVDQAMMQAVPVAGQSDLLRTLQILPGVASTADVSAKLYVRGGAGDQNLILLDGMKIYNPYHALGLFSVIDPDLVKSVEVYTGGFPAGLGGRLSSVVNVRTLTGTSNALSGIVLLDPVASKLQLGGPAGEENTWIISGRRSILNDPYKHILSNSVPLSFYDVFAKFSHWSSEIGRISLQGFLTGDDISSPRSDEPDYSWKNQAIGLSSVGLIGDRFYADASTYLNRFTIKRDAKFSSVPPAESNVSEFGIRGEFTMYSDARDVYLVGFDVSTSDFENTITNRDRSRHTYSDLIPEGMLWLRYQKSYGQLKADAGVQVDVTSIVNKGVGLYSFQPRINLSYAVGPDWRVKMSYGVFTQHAVTATNENDIVSLFEAWMAVPKELDPEQADHYVIGLEGNITPTLSVAVDGYYKAYRSLVLYNEEKVFYTDPDFVTGKGHSNGVECLLRYSSPAFDLYGSYTLGWAQITANGITYAPRYDRRHSISLMGVVRPFQHWDLSLLWQFGTGYPYSQTVGFYDRLLFNSIGGTQFYNDTGTPYAELGDKNAVRLPPYHRLDASITYRFEIAPLHLEAGFHVVNVYGRKNLLTFDRYTGQRTDMIPFYPSFMLKAEF